MSGKNSQWGILIIILVGLAILLAGVKQPETAPHEEATKAQAQAETPPKKIISAKKAISRPAQPIIEAERAPVLDTQTRSIHRN